MKHHLLNISVKHVSKPPNSHSHSHIIIYNICQNQLYNKYSWHSYSELIMFSFMSNYVHSRQCPHRTTYSCQQYKCSFWNPPGMMYCLIFVQCIGCKCKYIYKDIRRIRCLCEWQNVVFSQQQGKRNACYHG